MGLSNPGHMMIYYESSEKTHLFIYSFIHRLIFTIKRFMSV